MSKYICYGSEPADFFAVELGEDGSTAPLGKAVAFCVEHPGEMQRALEHLLDGKTSVNVSFRDVRSLKSPQVIVTWHDQGNLPRAWGSGPADQLDQVKATARVQLEKYVTEKGGSLDDFTEKVETYD